MTRSTVLLALILSASSFAWAGEEGMPGMPKIRPKKVFTIPTQEAGEELESQRGFGDQEPMVRMMNLMMVGGSGYEGMDMTEMHGKDMASGAHAMGQEGHAQGAASSPAAQGSEAVDARLDPNPPKVGANRLIWEVKDVKTGKPVTGLKFEADLLMTSMDMGIEHPRIRERPPGHYEMKLIFSMKGPWQVRLKAAPAKGKPGLERIYNFNPGANDHWVGK